MPILNWDFTLKDMLHTCKTHIINLQFFALRITSLVVTINEFIICFLEVNAFISKIQNTRGAETIFRLNLQSKCKQIKQGPLCSKGNLKPLFQGLVNRRSMDSVSDIVAVAMRNPTPPVQIHLYANVMHLLLFLNCAFFFCQGGMVN